MLDNPWTTALLALILWWLSTGLLMLRVRRADNAGGDQHLWSVLMGLPLLVAGIGGAHATAGLTSPEGAFAAFLSAMAVWGWIELAFLSGLITGPNRRPLPAGITGWPRFLAAYGTLAWHEMALLAGFVGIDLATRGGDNRFAFWTFAILFAARISAKLNLFLGVPRFHTEFLPKTLAHLPSHFRRAPLNPLFPASITVLSLAAFLWLERILQAPTPGEETGFVLLLSLTLLALLEHWFMVLPLPDQKLWRWMLPARNSDL
jgi:putative photosynthetic complex assembly protein 2